MSWDVGLPACNSMLIRWTEPQLHCRTKSAQRMHESKEKCDVTLITMQHTSMLLVYDEHRFDIAAYQDRT